MALANNSRKIIPCMLDSNKLQIHMFPTLAVYPRKRKNCSRLLSTRMKAQCRNEARSAARTNNARWRGATRARAVRDGNFARGTICSHTDDRLHNQAMSRKQRPIENREPYRDFAFRAFRCTTTTLYCSSANFEFEHSTRDGNRVINHFNFLIEMYHRINDSPRSLRSLFSHHDAGSPDSDIRLRKATR